MPNPCPYCRITVVDQETGRGVPLVRLSVTSGIHYHTDSAGVAAFLEPGLMGRSVYFLVEGDGYAIDENDWAERGVVLRPRAGGRAVIEVRRLLPGRRLYRTTGLAPYRDSMLLGDGVPTANPPLNGRVLGQDSVHVEKYQDRLFWLWGDTLFAGKDRRWNIEVTAAFSDLPSHGGLDPETGVDLEYFKDADGYTKKMIAPEFGGALTWLDGLVALDDPSGEERLFAHYVQMRREPAAGVAEQSETCKALGMFWTSDLWADRAELARCEEAGPQAVREYKEKMRDAKERYSRITRGLVEFDPETEHFNRVAEFPEREVEELHIGAQAFKARDRGVEYVYYPGQFPNRRVRADVESIKDIEAYEAFTCLKQGARFDGSAEQLDRDAEGRLLYGWKKNTSPIGPEQQAKLAETGGIRPDERWIVFRNAESGEELRMQHNAIRWNAYRKRWVGFFTEVSANAKGASLRNTWYGEADTPIGPWAYVVKVAGFDNYNFYNPCHNPYFDKDGGRVVFFEGTYTNSSLNRVGPVAPRHDYNQVTYMLELDDARLFLPVAVYRLDGGAYATWSDIPKNYSGGRTLAFFAPDRPREGTAPVHEVRRGDAFSLTLSPKEGESARVAFYAEPAEHSPHTLPLHEHVHGETGARLYSTEESAGDGEYARSKHPVCHVWGAPSSIDLFADRKAR